MPDRKPMCLWHSKMNKEISQVHRSFHIPPCKRLLEISGEVLSLTSRIPKKCNWTKDLWCTNRTMSCPKREMGGELSCPVKMWPSAGVQQAMRSLGWGLPRGVNIEVEPTPGECFCCADHCVFLWKEKDMEVSIFLPCVSTFKIRLSYRVLKERRIQPTSKETPPCGKPCLLPGGCGSLLASA